LFFGTFCLSLHLDVADTGLSKIATGNFYAPLEVATGGTSLLVNDINVDMPGSSIQYPERYRVSADGNVGDGPTSLNLGSHWQVGSTPLGVLSPDGAMLAMDDSNVTKLIDVASATVITANLGKGIPVAWDPSGMMLLVRNLASDNATVVLSSLSLDGANGTFAAQVPYDMVPDPPNAPWCDRKPRYFWTNSGPKLLVQDCKGVRVYDYVTGGVVEIVEVNRVAPPLAPVGIVVATDQVFAWALQCYGLGESSYTSELRRFSLATGEIDVVASADGPFAFTVSPDGRQIAFADDTSLYIKSINP
jgi:hypothetical protein